MKKVVILGAGKIGGAISHLLKKAPVKIEMWDKDPSKLPHQKPLPEILPGADYAFMCLPSWCTRAAVAEYRPLLSPQTVMISLAKGIETGSRKTIDALLQETLPPRQPIALLAGPMLADEITQDLKAAAVLATKNPTVFKNVAALFQKSGLLLTHERDVRGVAYSSVLKNVYAIALGITDGLGWGGNRKGWVAAQAIHEMEGLIVALGSKRETVHAPSGLADFLATAYSPYSRNRMVGDSLVRTGQCCLQSEGLVSMPSLLKLLGKKRALFPLFKGLEAILVRGKKAQTVFESLFV